MAGGTHYIVTRPDGATDRYPRVSLILSVLAKGEQLEAWKERVGLERAGQELRAAQDIGDTFHAWVEKWITDRSAPVPDGIEHMAEQFLRAMRALSPSFLCAERVVASHKHRYAGTADAVARVDGVWRILDWKTCGPFAQWHWTYPLQTTAYSVAWNETMAGDMPAVEYPAIIVRVDKWTPEQHAEREEDRRRKMEASLAAMKDGAIKSTQEKQDALRRRIERFRPRRHVPLEVISAPGMEDEWHACMKLYQARNGYRPEDIPISDGGF